eukprot:845314-Prymnesium_polylepis.1
MIFKRSRLRCRGPDPVPRLMYRPCHTCTAPIIVERAQPAHTRPPAAVWPEVACFCSGRRFAPDEHAATARQ